MIYINKKVIVSVIYRSPSQNNDNFHAFISNFQKLISNINKHKPTLSVIAGEFNARSSSWWSNDINTTEESKLYSLTASNGFDQLINESRHIQTKSFPCTGFIFINQLNVSVNFGIQASLHPDCHHHQVVHLSFNLSIS